MEEITIKYDRDPYDSKCYVYAKASAMFQKGLTVLVGCNGTGKTTMLHIIEDELRKQNIHVISFDNLNDGGRNVIGMNLFLGNLNDVILDVESSEGEKIYNNIGRFGGEVRRAEKIIFDSDNLEKTTMVILLDAIDSGLSIDNIVEIKDFLRLIINDQKERNNIDVFIITVANEYEMANGEQCYDVAKGKPITFKDYNSYRRFVLNSRKLKDKRNEKWDIQLEKNREEERKKRLEYEERRTKEIQKRKERMAKLKEKAANKPVSNKQKEIDKMVEERLKELSAKETFESKNTNNYNYYSDSNISLYDN